VLATIEYASWQSYDVAQPEINVFTASLSDE
jgi:hypothetical protein